MAQLVKCPSGAFHELTHILSPLIIAILFCDTGELNTFFIFQLPWCRIWGRVWESYTTHLKSYSCLKIPAFLCELVGVYHMCDELVSFEQGDIRSLVFPSCKLGHCLLAFLWSAWPRLCTSKVLWDFGFGPSAGDVRDARSIPGSRRYSGEGYDNPLQSSCLENPVDRGAWQAIAHGIVQSQTRLKRLCTSTWREMWVIPCRIHLLVVEW